MAYSAFPRERLVVETQRTHGKGVQGKRLGSHVIETNGILLVDFFKKQAGAIHVCLDEGTPSGWLVEIYRRTWTGSS